MRALFIPGIFALIVAFASPAAAQSCGECADEENCVLGCELDAIIERSCTICWSGNPCLEQSGGDCGFSALSVDMGTALAIATPTPGDQRVIDNTSRWSGSEGELSRQLRSCNGSILLRQYAEPAARLIKERTAELAI